MFSCKKMSQLVSESFDRDLTFMERMKLKFHIVMCRVCSGHKHDLEKLREMIKSRLHDADAGGSEKLSTEARDRIRQVLSSIE